MKRRSSIRWAASLPLPSPINIQNSIYSGNTKLATRHQTSDQRIYRRITWAKKRDIAKEEANEKAREQKDKRAREQERDYEVT